MSIPLLSFFTGGGILDMGFEAAGFHIAWTNEIDVQYAEMYAHGMSSWRKAELGREDNATISNQKSIAGISAARILKEGFGGRAPRLFGIIGGPPCNDFSSGGIHRGSNGAYGGLTKVFANRICSIQPSFFVMENVSGLFRTRTHREFLDCTLDQFQQKGYRIYARILNALEYGVPQDRERLFVIGVKRTLFRAINSRGTRRKKGAAFLWPEPEYPDSKKLPWPRISNSMTPRRPRRIPIELTVYPYLKSHPSPVDLPNGKDYFRPYSSRFRTQLEGDVYAKSFKRLHRYRYSPTAWYGNNEVHLHPWENRRLSVREAMRVQSIPDTYVLPSDKPLSKKFQLVCSAVPYVLALRIAQSLRIFLKPVSN